jgi:hypothetical protein
MNPTPEQYKAIARLESNNNPDWKSFKDVLRSAKEEMNKTLESVTPMEGVYRAQGKSLILSDLIDFIERSREIAKAHSERS